MLSELQENMKFVGEALSTHLARNEADEVDVFARLIAKKLKRVKSERSSDQLQEQILSLVNSTLYRKYENAESSLYSSTWTQL